MTDQEANAYIKVIVAAKESGMTHLKLPGFESTWSMSQVRQAIAQNKKPLSRVEALAEWYIPIGKLKEEGFTLGTAPKKRLESLLWYLDNTENNVEPLNSIGKETQVKIAEYLELISKTSGSAR